MALSSSPRVTAVSWNLFHAPETVLEDTANHLAMARIDVQSWRSWTAWAISIGSRYHFMSPEATYSNAK